MGRLYNLSARVARQRADADRLVRTYSGKAAPRPGRVGTTGIGGRVDVWALIHLVSSGTTVLLTTQYLAAGSPIGSA